MKHEKKIPFKECNMNNLSFCIPKSRSCISLLKCRGAAKKTERKHEQEEAIVDACCEAGQYDCDCVYTTSRSSSVIFLSLFGIISATGLWITCTIDYHVTKSYMNNVHIVVVRVSVCVSDLVSQVQK